MDEGNKAPQTGLAETIKKVFERFEEQGILSMVEEVLVRRNSAGWLRELIWTIQEEEGQKFIIKARKDDYIKGTCQECCV